MTKFNLTGHVGKTSGATALKKEVGYSNDVFVSLTTWMNTAELSFHTSHIPFWVAMRQLSDEALASLGHPQEPATFTIGAAMGEAAPPPQGVVSIAPDEDPTIPF